MPKMKMNYHDQYDRVWLMKKTRQKNDLADHTGAVYHEK